MAGTGAPRPAADLGDQSDLLATLLEYVLGVLHADHVTFCRTGAGDEPITVLAAAGRLTHPELWPGLGPMYLDHYGYDGPAEDRGDVVAVYGPGGVETPGVLAFLERVGAVYDVTIRVFDAPPWVYILEVYYSDAQRPFGDREIDEATRLAKLLSALIARDMLGRELVAAEQRFRTLVEQIPAIPYLVDSSTVSIFQSPRMNDLLGMPRDRQLALDDWERAIHPDDRQRVARSYMSHIHTGRAFEEEYRLIAADGEVHWFVDRATLIEREEGLPLSHGVMFDITEARRAQDALRESEQRRLDVLEAMLRAEAEARAGIATELHDDTIQSMTAALIAIDGVRRTVGAGGAASEETLRMARDTVAEAIERVRRQSFELRPPLLEAQGLKAAVRDLAEESALEAGFLVEVDADVGRLPFGIEDLAYRTIKEAMANARKHAAARHVRVALRRLEDMLEGEVEDDGRGFDVGRALDRRTMRLHMGLDSMRERLHLTGGELVIESTPGQGSRIRFRIPIVG